MDKWIYVYVLGSQTPPTPAISPAFLSNRVGVSVNVRTYVCMYVHDVYVCMYVYILYILYMKIVYMYICRNVCTYVYIYVYMKMIYQRPWKSMSVDTTYTATTTLLQGRGGGTYSAPAPWAP